MRTVIPRRALAGVIIMESGHALSAVSAGELVALVHHLDLAVPAREPDGAGARVVLAGVEARGSVVTRSVIGAEVEVLVAHLTAPTLFALAGPGTGAGAVNTPGVDLALGALCPLPTLVTYALSGLVTVPIGLAASWGTYGFETVIVACRVLVVFLPSLKTDLFPLGAAGVVTKVVMSRLADDVAVGPVVALAAHQPVLVLELPIVAVDPVVAGVKTLAVQAPVEQLGGVLADNVVFMISLDDEGEGSRPLEVDIELDG